jgi:hypothetical protein
MYVPKIGFLGGNLYCYWLDVIALNTDVCGYVMQDSHEWSDW